MGEHAEQQVQDGLDAEATGEDETYEPRATQLMDPEGSETVGQETTYPNDSDGPVTTDDGGDDVSRETFEPEVTMGPPAGVAVAAPPQRKPMSLVDFLAQNATPEALEANTKLSEAFDRACASLVTAADVVIDKASGRAFKKKSAWKKLGRAFGVSVEIIDMKTWYDADEDGTQQFNAMVTARAVAPWGQYADAVGACSTREEKYVFMGIACPVCHGPTWDNRKPQANWPQWKVDKFERGDLPAFSCRNKNCGGIVAEGDYDPAAAEGGAMPNPTARAKALHDVTATAQTRASNRSISDLIAAGEVSAEEVEGTINRGGEPAGGPEGAGNGPKSAQDGRSAPAPAGTPGPAPAAAGGLLDAKVGGRGKYADHTWREVLRDDPSYVAWMLGKEGKEKKLRVRNAKLAAALDTALAARKAEPDQPEVDRSKLDLTQEQKDCIAGLLDTKWFDSSLPDHRAMKDWCVKVGSGELKPSEAAASEAILKLSKLSEKKEVETVVAGDHPTAALFQDAPDGEEAGPDDDLPF